MAQKHIKTEITRTNVEQMNIVMIGHVDHGKSTVIGRLLADTGSLPEGKLEAVKANCAYNARPFEYAFLLDALKDEQAQGITIDSARCFFRSDKREYIIIDAPGHIEFLKNMISGAARAEAAVLVIDAKEGVRENSRRHGYLLSMLGIKQVAVCVNKMDLVDYSREVFDSVEAEYKEFLSRIDIEPIGFVPASAMMGDNIVENSPNMAWFDGPSVLEIIDSFVKEPSRINKPLRFPVQDIYKFTAEGDDRRIIAGRIETGAVNVGDEVVFMPSKKRSRVTSIEGFNLAPQTEAHAGQSTGVILEEQIYITPGELMCKVTEPQAEIGAHLKVNIFWMGRQPMIKGKRYKIKLGSVRMPVWLRDVVTVLDASDLTTDSTKQQVDRHDVAECVLETLKPIAFDLSHEIARTGRFVIIDNYEIAGGGVVLDTVKGTTNRTVERVKEREKSWDRSSITPAMRADRYKQGSTLILICGPVGAGKQQLAKALEEDLFRSNRSVYYLGLANSLLGVDVNVAQGGERDEYLRRLAEVSHLFTDAGLILITTISDLDEYELEMVKTLNQPNDCRVINVGESRFSDAKIDLQVDDLSDQAAAITRIKDLLVQKKYIVEYYL
jgi:bifunctional enzyme CysN/CysC